jgi:hypothetical protein
MYRSMGKWKYSLESKCSSIIEDEYIYSGLQKELEQFQITNILCFSDPLEALF